MREPFDLRIPAQTGERRIVEITSGSFFSASSAVNFFSRF
jgi:hypothetical protein